MLAMQKYTHSRSKNKLNIIKINNRQKDTQYNDNIIRDRNTCTARQSKQNYDNKPHSFIM